MTHEEIVNEVHSLVLKWPASVKLNFFMAPWKGESLIQHHHELGRYIRNKYNLWTIPWEPEIIDGCDHSPYHPDQRSMTIIQDVWKKGLDNGS